MTRKDHLDTLAASALAVSALAPMRRPSASVCCYIPWDLVEAIRETAEAAGIDWRKAHRSRPASGIRKATAEG